MKVLILGGRKFLGRHIVDSCLKNNHEVTLFNRNQTNAHLYTNLETITGDRYLDLKQLESETWDVVIDTSGFDPSNVASVANTLAKNVKHYIFISSCSVYNQTPKSKLRDENAEIVNIDIDYNNLDPFGKDYGACKFLSERAIDEIFKPGLTTHIRAGLIVGPYDSTSRFPYWVNRLHKGDATLAPPPDYPTQFIDARDLADWCVHLMENKIAGIFNASGPERNTITVRDFLELANNILGNKSELYYCSEEFLTKNNIKCWTELPLWVVKEVEAFMLMDSNKANQHGLKLRSIQDTVLSTLHWLESENIDLNNLKYTTLSSEKEREVLERYHDNSMDLIRGTTFQTQKT